MYVSDPVRVLHGTCHMSENGVSFFFWSEISNFKVDDTASVHPFSMGSKSLLQILNKGQMIGNKTAKSEKLEAIFPSLENIPLPSGDLEGLLPEKNNTHDLFFMQKFEIPGITMDMYDAFTFLLEISQSHSDILLGPDIKFWKTASIMAYNVLALKKFLPAVEDHGTSIISKWIPILETQEDQNLLYELAKNMPGSCLCLNYGQTDSETLLRAFLTSVVDSACRRFSNQPNVSQRSGDAIKWAVSLSSPNPLITYGRSLSMLKISSWSRMIQTRLEFPLGMSFDLLPPEDDHGMWHLRFLLQSKRDPSLIIPFSKVWNQKDRETKAVIAKYTEYPEEFLLQSLGVAQLIFPPIRKSLQSTNPSEVLLTSTEVYEFLKNYSNILRESGFSVLFPDWWGKTGKGIGLKIKAKPSSGKSMGILGKDALINYNLEIIYDGEPLSEKELEELVKLKTPLVRIGKKWVEVDNDHLKLILNMLKKKQEAVTLRELLSLDAEKGALPVIDISGEGWVGELLGGNSNLKPMNGPYNFKGKLREYQKRGSAWLNFITALGFGCCLADDMGLGKTIEIIAFLLNRYGKKSVKGTTLIICPTSVISNWMHELNKFAPSLTVMEHHGSLRMKGDDFINRVSNYNVVLTSYSLLQRDAAVFSRTPWDGIVADEAQYVKNSATKQSKAIRGLKANFRIALTGTPVENRLEDLKSIFDFLNPGYLGNDKRFRELFSNPIMKEEDDEAAMKLNRLVNPFILRRVKTDKSIISDLPDKDEIKAYVPITLEQASLYEATVRTMLESVTDKEGIQRSGIILSTITKLKRLLDHPSMVTGDTDKRSDRSEKLTRLMDMLEETLGNKEKTIVFTQYIEAGRIIKESLLRKFREEALFLSGSTPRPLREQMISRFQSPEGPKIFIISLKAGGFGINLTAATNVIHFDRWWNPSIENQATDRAYRIGQSKRVRVYKFISTGTVEEKIDEIIEGKTTLSKKIVKSTSETWITELNTKDLREVFSLRKETIDMAGVS